MNRKAKLLVAICFIVLIAGVSVVILYTISLVTPSDSLRILWWRDLENVATDVKVADGNVFTTQAGRYDWAQVFCYDEQSGEKVWNTSEGDFARWIVVDEGKMYVGSRGSVVNSLDVNTGGVVLQFHAPVSTSAGQKSAPIFSVAEGRVFASSDGCAAYNASTGALLWETPRESPRLDIPFIQRVWPFKDNLVLAAWRDSDPSDIFRINPNNGSLLWSFQGWTSTPPIVSQGQVILWNYDAIKQDVGQIVLSVDSSSGIPLWDFDVGASIFQPIAYNGLLLFGAFDGNFYALHLTNGTLAWKTRVDSQEIMAGNNLPATAKFNSPPGVSQVLVDSEIESVFWGFAVSQLGVGGVDGVDHYVGVLVSLNLSSGDILWMKDLAGSGAVSSLTLYRPVLSLFHFRSTLYLYARDDLWNINKSNGNIHGTQHFVHYIAVVSDNKMFVATDFQLRVYA